MEGFYGGYNEYGGGSSGYGGGGSQNNSTSDGPGPIPNRWLHCPRTAQDFIANRFLAFKTPLSARFASQMGNEFHFTPDMVFSYMKMEKKKLGLWIDLTNTKRFYDRSDIEKKNCQYMKLKCRGHAETPSLEQTRAFIEIVDTFTQDHPLDYVGVHCTHGFNRTGFLIVSYMVERMDCSVEAAILAFAHARPPGIYKQDYINELYRRYDDEEDAKMAPELPEWCKEYDDGDGDGDGDGDHSYGSGPQQNATQNKRKQENGNNDTENDVDGESSTSESVPRRKRRKEHLKLNATFMPGVQGVHLVTEQPRLGDLQETIRKMCKFKGSGFPGSQPVSMDMKNIRLLSEKPYRVSWKADGARYMMLILKENEVFFFDRDNSCFQVTGVTFPDRDDITAHIYDTLIDGEMVIDKVGGKSIPRYLVYDIVCYNGVNYMENAFYSDDHHSIVTRLRCIKERIIEPRHIAMKKGRILRNREPFSVRDKSFWEITQAKKLLEPKFANTLAHEPDGLIFQPSADPYIPGQCNVVLKWKPLSMNSVDFKLVIHTEGGPGILPKKVGLLFVGGLDRPFASMKWSRQLKEYHNKIIECKLENNEWVFMRERTDKSFPNSFLTATAVMESIRNPVTPDILEEHIERYRFREMLPPQGYPPRHHHHLQQPQQHPQHQQQPQQQHQQQ